VPEEYSILERKGTKEWTGKEGRAFIDYALLVKRTRDGEELDVILTQITSTDAPDPGQVIDGNITETKYGKKLKKHWDGGGGGGGFSNNGNGPSGRGEDPEKGKRIQRMAALKGAVALAIADGKPSSDEVARLTNELEGILINAAAKPANPTESAEHPKLVDAPSSNGKGADPEVPF